MFIVAALVADYPCKSIAEQTLTREIRGKILITSDDFWNTFDDFWSTSEDFWNASGDFWRLLMTSDARLPRPGNRIIYRQTTSERGPI